MTKLITWSLAFILFCSCASKKAIPSYPSLSEARAEILQVMKHQEKAWSEGDIDGFMDGYWNSEELSFIGKSGLNKGWMTTLKNYKKGYPDKTAMGTLKFDVIELNQLAPDVYHMIGRYTLIRELDRPQGFYSLIWKYVDGKWKIISDHTSG